jgi:hypothetical protein
MRKFYKHLIAASLIILFTNYARATTADDEYRNCVVGTIARYLAMPNNCLVDTIVQAMDKVSAAYANCFTKSGFKEDELKEKSKIDFDMELEIRINKKALACGMKGEVTIRDKGSFRQIDESILDNMRGPTVPSSVTAKSLGSK